MITLTALLLLPAVLTAPPILQGAVLALVVL